MAGRYSITDPDLFEYIKSLEKRISKLERTPQTAYSGVNKEGIVIMDGGSLSIIRDADTIPQTTYRQQGQMLFGTDVATGLSGEIGMRLRIDRSQSIPGADYYPASVGGQRINGNTVVDLSTVDGSLKTGPDTWDLTGCNTSIELADKSGYAMVSDTFGARRGLGRPYIPVPVYLSTSASLQSSTSGTFAEYYELKWEMQHPHLHFTFFVSNDASNSGEIQISSLLDSKVLATWATTSGASEFEEFDLKRSSSSFGGGGNGDAEWLSVQFRRATGAGTVRFRVVGAMGWDGSQFGDF